MILVLGSETDWCVQEVLAHARQQDVPIAFVPTTDFGGDLGISWTLDGTSSEGYLQIHGTRLPFEELTGVFVRHAEPPPDDVLLSAEERQYALAEQAAARLGLFNALRCPVINRPIPGTWIDPTFFGTVARAVEAAGLGLPPRLTTGSPDRAREFIDRHASHVLVRAAVAGRPLLLSGLSALPSGPVCLQAVPAGEWVRVFVAGDQAIATAVAEDELKPEVTGFATWPSVPLPESMRRHCLCLAAALGLGLCELLLRNGPDGRHYCFAVNENPYYACCEPLARWTLTTALVDALAGGRQERKVA
jgi:hypothetical protein